MMDAGDTRELLPKLRKWVLKMHSSNSNTLQSEAWFGTLEGHRDFNLSLNPHITLYSSHLFSHTLDDAQRILHTVAEVPHKWLLDVCVSQQPLVS